MRLFLLGGSGCFGTALCALAAAEKLDIVAPSRSELDILDACALEASIRKAAPDALVNSVAMVGINPCEEFPAQACRLHIEAAHTLIKICRSLGIRYVQTSSHAVFDGAKTSPYDENDTPNPASVYGVTKLAAELLTLNQSPGGLVVRFPTLFGPRRNSALGFVDKMIAQLKQGRPVRVAADKIDSPTFAKDAALSLCHLLRHDSSGVYHLANAGSASYFEFVLELRQMLGSKAAVEPAKDADFPALAPKPLRTPLTSVRLAPNRPWREALAEYLGKGGV
jgi:dTDP-4-dehydrorhamnose reductase